MFQMIVILRRKPGMSVEEYRKHWREKHGSLFRKFPQIKKYTQYHVSDHARDDTDQPIDGVAILEFESKDAMNEAWKMADYEAIRIDEPRFLDIGSKGVHVVHVDAIESIIGDEPAL